MITFKQYDLINNRISVSNNRFAFSIICLEFKHNSLFTDNNTTNIQSSGNIIHNRLHRVIYTSASIWMSFRIKLTVTKVQKYIRQHAHITTNISTELTYYHMNINISHVLFPLSTTSKQHLHESWSSPQKGDNRGSKRNFFNYVISSLFVTQMILFFT